MELSKRCILNTHLQQQEEHFDFLAFSSKLFLNWVISYFQCVASLIQFALWYTDLLAPFNFFVILFFNIDILFHRDAATVMLSGQVADGFTTIFAGELVVWNELLTCLDSKFNMLYIHDQLLQNLKILPYYVYPIHFFCFAYFFGSLFVLSVTSSIDDLSRVM